MIKNRRKKAGFTLVELMIAVSILGLVIILSVPNFSRFINTWRLKGEAEQFGVALRTARSVAVMKNIDVVFSFNANNNTYSYFEDKDRDGSIDSDEYESAIHELPATVSIVAYTLSSTVLTFGSKGNTRETGTITLRNTDNEIKTIRIYGGTGNITIE